MRPFLARQSTRKVAMFRVGLRYTLDNARAPRCISSQYDLSLVHLLK